MPPMAKKDADQGKASKKTSKAAKQAKPPAAEVVLPPLPVLVPNVATDKDPKRVAKPAKPKAAKASAKPAAKPVKAAKTTKPPKAAKPVAQVPVPSNDDIALRAYYIAERRQKLGWPGDSTSDWIEAERQLLAEARRAR